MKTLLNISLSRYEEKGRDLDRVRRIAITKIKSRVTRVRVASTEYARIFNAG